MTTSLCSPCHMALGIMDACTHSTLPLLRRPTSRLCSVHVYLDNMRVVFMLPFHPLTMNFLPRSGWWCRLQSYGIPACTCWYGMHSRLMDWHLKWAPEWVQFINPVTCSRDLAMNNNVFSTIYVHVQCLSLKVYYASAP